jgi:hypothetical protein
MTEISRRSLLHGGTALGLSALTAAGSSPAGAAAPDQHLVLNYLPSQPHGWPGGQDAVGMTLGGHTTSNDFSYAGKAYRISLYPSDPIYRAVPQDPVLDYRRVLNDAFGAYYAFHYLGGFKGRNEFNIQSYGVFVEEPTEARPETIFGGGPYVVYDPDLRRGDPPIQEDLHWIQVPAFLGTASWPSSVDNSGRANPFYDLGGLISIFGNETFNFQDVSRVGGTGGPTLDVRFVAETFLAQDTGRKDSSGRCVVKIFGGFTWGWQVQEV